ncbi:hypothetical protein FB451DRAFT_1365562 [Mycena latifolia]|nr:hypothetical protein FB451DRAFT_1365562 [Mycena latifolia]
MHRNIPVFLNSWTTQWLSDSQAILTPVTDGSNDPCNSDFWCKLNSSFILFKVALATRADCKSIYSAIMYYAVQTFIHNLHTGRLQSSCFNPSWDDPSLRECSSACKFKSVRLEVKLTSRHLSSFKMKPRVHICIRGSLEPLCRVSGDQFKFTARILTQYKRSTARPDAFRLSIITNPCQRLTYVPGAPPYFGGMQPDFSSRPHPACSADWPSRYLFELMGGESVKNGTAAPLKPECGVEVISCNSPAVTLSAIGRRREPKVRTFKVRPIISMPPVPPARCRPPALVARCVSLAALTITQQDSGPLGDCRITGCDEKCANYEGGETLTSKVYIANRRHAFNFSGNSNHSSEHGLRVRALDIFILEAIWAFCLLSLLWAFLAFCASAEVGGRSFAALRFKPDVGISLFLSSPLAPAHFSPAFRSLGKRLRQVGRHG